MVSILFALLFTDIEVILDDVLVKYTCAGSTPGDYFNLGVASSEML